MLFHSRRRKVVQLLNETSVSQEYEVLLRSKLKYRLYCVQHFSLSRSQFGSSQLYAHVQTDLPNFLWVITRLACFLIYDFCCNYPYRIILFRYACVRFCSQCSSNYVRRADWSLARRNLRGVLARDEEIYRSPNIFNCIVLTSYRSITGK